MVDSKLFAAVLVGILAAIGLLVFLSFERPVKKPDLPVNPPVEQGERQRRQRMSDQAGQPGTSMMFPAKQVVSP